MNKLIYKEKKDRQIILSKLKQRIRKTIENVNKFNPNHIEEKGAENLNKIINNDNLSVHEIYKQFFNSNNKYYLEGQYCYMRNIYSYLTQLLSKNNIIIIKDDVLFNDEQQNNNLNQIGIKEEKEISSLNNLEIELSIQKDRNYHKIYSLFKSIIANNDKDTLDEFRKIIGNNTYDNYIMFRKNKSITEIEIYKTENYSIFFRRKNKNILFTLRKKIVSDLNV